MQIRTTTSGADQGGGGGGIRPPLISFRCKVPPLEKGLQ